MKNKEIEELLNELKNTADTSFFAVCGSKEELDKMPKGVCKFLSLNDKQAKLLLLYIEQLETKVKNLQNQVNTIKDNNEELKRRLKLVQRKRDTHKAVRYRLQNNRDKAVREIMHMIEEGNITFFKGKKLENILIGDSK